jgi:hypothetical protein
MTPLDVVFTALALTGTVISFLGFLKSRKERIAAERAADKACEVRLL